MTALAGATLSALLACAMLWRILGGPAARRLRQLQGPELVRTLLRKLGFRSFRA